MWREFELILGSLRKSQNEIVDLHYFPRLLNVVVVANQTQGHVQQRDYTTVSSSSLDAATVRRCQHSQSLPAAEISLLCH
ncbi:hypothetical protein J6590_086025 [Homalodisca vitripennis]|nr:hypothetical protein J6590_086025 [Homalodisca vitripennis]